LKPYIAEAGKPGIVMLSEAKHLGFGPAWHEKYFRDGKAGLAAFVRCIAASLRSE
jgi:hypothetical protein